MSMLGIEHRLHWWEARALTTGSAGQLILYYLCIILVFVPSDDIFADTSASGKPKEKKEKKKAGKEKATDKTKEVVDDPLMS